MPIHCCLTGCRSNYTATMDQQCEISSALKFPEDPILRALWIKKMPRKNLEVYKRTVVCEKNFASQYIVRVDTVIQPDETILSVPRQCVKLTGDAISSYFPNTPAFLYSEPPKRRGSSDGRRAEMIA